MQLIELLSSLATIRSMRSIITKQTTAGLALSASFGLLCSFGSAAPKPSGPSEVGDAYTITTTTRIAKPYDVRAMNDEFQSARLLSEQDGVGTFEITYRPFHVQHVGSNPNWRVDDAKMTEYLTPRPCANWDADLRKQILADLRAAGIEPDRLDDRTLVEKVSNWALGRSKFNNQFGLWMVEFHDGNPQVAAGLKSSFKSNEPSGLPLGQIFDQELYGKGMYLNKTHGACTSSSTYMATILRAIGIPTRIILTVPACDPNDPMQVKALTNAIRHNKTAHTIKMGLASQGFVNHVYNEVWVGKKWVRLNYSTLGQPILDANYCGLMTHVYTATDVSEIPFAKTWGERFAIHEGPILSSVNPYQMLKAKDSLKPGVTLDNPKVAELSSSTIIRILKRGDSAIPTWAALPREADGYLEVKEWLSGETYSQMSEFESEASSDFTLSAKGQPDVRMTLTGLTVSDGRGNFQAYAFKLSDKPIPGVTYQITPHNEDHARTWTVGANVAW